MTVPTILLAAGLVCFGVAIVMMARRVEALARLVRDMASRDAVYRRDLERIERKANSAVRTAGRAGR